MTDEIQRPNETHVRSNVSADLNSKYIRKIPATQMANPAPDRPQSIICWLLLILRLRTEGRGSRTTPKSVKVLILPLMARCSFSLIHFCGVSESVQYAEGGLPEVRNYGHGYWIERGWLYLQVNITMKQKIRASVATMNIKKAAIWRIIPVHLSRPVGSRSTWTSS